MIDKIAPCPFCGGEAWLNGNDKGDIYWIECKECNARTSPVCVDERKSKIPVFSRFETAEAYLCGKWERRAEY